MMRSLFLAWCLSMSASVVVVGFAPRAHPIRIGVPALQSQPIVSTSFGVRTNPEVGSLVFALAAASSSTTPATPLEIWLVSHLEEWYSRSVTIKCPFFRRRAADALDAMDMVLRFLVVRHKSLDILPPLGCRTTNMSPTKNRNLEMTQIAAIIEKDWKVATDKGYYITGRLNTTIYRDDCCFDGPDPDMPVNGLRKYLNAASQLFDYAKSRAELMKLTIEADNTIVAKWRIQGVLRLPWRPVLPELNGVTTYYFDEDQLIYLHKETWDLSVVEAFVKTMAPHVAERIWDQKSQEA